MYDFANSKQKGGRAMNQIGLVGRLTKNPVLKNLSDNRVQTYFTIAVNRNFRNYKGDIDTDFLFCTAWGKLAEHIVKYCGKGSLIGVNGRLQSRNYVREDNTKIYMTEVVVEDVRFYVLKPKDYEKEETKAASMTESMGQQIAESAISTDFTQSAEEKLNSNEFVLPKEEPHLPIL